MALIATVEATVTYTCWLSEEDEEKVLEYISGTDLSIADAIMELYDLREIDLYKNSGESNFYTNYIASVYRDL